MALATKSDEKAAIRNSALHATDNKSERESDPSSPPSLPLFLQGLAKSKTLRAKLSVSQPNEPDELDADATAEHVMSMSEPLPRDHGASLSGNTPSSAEQLNHCSAEMPLMDELGGSGEPLPLFIRAFFEPRFGRDFAQVRVHAGTPAAKSAQSIRARAFTVGQNVVFGAGQYSPETAGGRKLIAHELAHTLQPSTDSKVRRDGPDSTSVAGTQAELVRRAVSSGDPSDIKEITDFSSATQEQRLNFLAILCAQGWVGPYDEWAIESIWRSFGNLIEVASANLGLWKECIEKGAELDEFPAVVRLQEQFKSDIKTIVDGYLLNNGVLVLNEMERLGINSDENAAPAEPTDQQAEEIVHMQRAAESVAKLQKAQEEARRVYVGYKGETVVDHQSGYAVYITVPVTFDPYMQPPGVTPPSFFAPGVEVEIRPYQELKAKYDQATSMIEQYLVLYPTLYAISREAQSSTTANFAGVESPAQAHRMLGEGMRKLYTDIIQTMVKLDLGDLDPLDLTPIHQQLRSSPTGGPSGVNWQLALPSAIADEMVQDHDFSNALQALGLQTLAAALFFLAPFTGGASLFVMFAGLGAAGLKFYLSQEQFTNLSQAGRTSVTPGTELVTQPQIDEAEMAMDADAIALALAALAVGAAVATKVIGAIRGPAVVEPPPPARLGTSGAAAIEAMEGGVGIRLASSEGTVTGRIVARSPVAGGELVKVQIPNGPQADILLSDQAGSMQWRVLTAEETAAWNSGLTKGTPFEPRAILPNGKQAAPVYSSGYHGSAEVPPEAALSEGFPSRGSSWKLLEHVEQRGASAFRGTTEVVSDPVMETGAAYWAGEGGWVYDVREVPLWNANALLEGRVQTPGGFRGNLMHGEAEMSTASRIPPERIYRYGQVVSDSRGRLYVREWILNPRYKPPLRTSTGTTGGQQ